jgi:hypothetical protein
MDKELAEEHFARIRKLQDNFGTDVVLAKRLGMGREE